MTREELLTQKYERSNTKQSLERAHATIARMKKQNDEHVKVVAERDGLIDANKRLADRIAEMGNDRLPGARS